MPARGRTIVARPQRRRDACFGPALAETRAYAGHHRRLAPGQALVALDGRDAISQHERDRFQAAPCVVAPTVRERIGARVHGDDGSTEARELRSEVPVIATDVRDEARWSRAVDPGPLRELQAMRQARRKRRRGAAEEQERRDARPRHRYCSERAI